MDGNEFQRGEGGGNEVKKNFRWGVVHVKNGCIFAVSETQTQTNTTMKTQITEYPRWKGSNYEFTVNGNWMIIATTSKKAIKQFEDLTGRRAETVKQVSRYPFVEPVS
jgi:hypothetical protein